MLAKDFYAIIENEEKTVEFLKQNGLLPDADELQKCHGCGSDTKFYTRKQRNKERTVVRCTKKGCQKTQSIRKQNSFFTYYDKNGRCNSGLSLGQILEIVYYWCLDLPNKTVQTLTGRGYRTVAEWMNLCANVPLALFDKRTKMGGPGTVARVDECLLRPKRKFDREDEPLENGRPVDDREEDAIFCASNYGASVEGPWIFGMCLETHDGDGAERRYFVVERRDRETLHKIILDELELGTEIRSDDWPAYETVEYYGYVHKVVNRYRSCADPNTGTKTRRTESLWLPLKLKTLKEMYASTPESLSSYLANTSWRSNNKNEDLFLVMLRDIKTVYL